MNEAWKLGGEPRELPTSDGTPQHTVEDQPNLLTTRTVAIKDVEITVSWEADFFPTPQDLVKILLEWIKQMAAD